MAPETADPRIGDPQHLVAFFPLHQDFRRPFPEDHGIPSCSLGSQPTPSPVGWDRELNGSTEIPSHQ